MWLRGSSVQCGSVGTRGEGNSGQGGSEGRGVKVQPTQTPGQGQWQCQARGRGPFYGPQPTVLKPPISFGAHVSLKTRLWNPGQVILPVCHDSLSFHGQLAGPISKEICKPASRLLPPGDPLQI